MLLLLFCCGCQLAVTDVAELPDSPAGPSAVRSRQLPSLLVRSPGPSAKARPRGEWGLAALPDLEAPRQILTVPPGFAAERLLPAELGCKNGTATDLRQWAKRLRRSPWYHGVVDLVARSRPLRRDAAATERLLVDWRRDQGEAAAQLESALRPMLHAGLLYGGAWSPARTESASGRDDDGILVAAPIDLADLAELPESWRAVAGAGARIQQAAALIHAPLATVLELERDFAAQMRFAGQDAADIFPVAGSHLLRRDVQGAQWRYLEVLFHKHLGLLLGQLAYVLRQVDWVDGDGDVVMENYALPQSLGGCHSFKWLAGRNSYLSLRNRAGRAVATLVVTQLTFDIDGLWESDRQRVEAMRFSLGNLKLEAERRNRANRPATTKPSK